MSDDNEHDLQNIRGKITGSTPGRPVFFKGMWMAIPLPFIPPSANREEDTKSEQPSQCAIKIFGSIVPYLWESGQLRDFCQRQDIPFLGHRYLREKESEKDRSRFVLGKNKTPQWETVSALFSNFYLPKFR